MIFKQMVLVTFKHTQIMSHDPDVFPLPASSDVSWHVVNMPNHAALAD